MTVLLKRSKHAAMVGEQPVAAYRTKYVDRVGIIPVGGYRDYSGGRVGKARPVSLSKAGFARFLMRGVAMR